MITSRKLIIQSLGLKINPKSVNDLISQFTKVIFAQKVIHKMWSIRLRLAKTGRLRKCYSKMFMNHIFCYGGGHTSSRSIRAKNISYVKEELSRLCPFNWHICKLQ